MTERIERRYTTDLDVSDGRTIIGRCVPYNEPALVADAGNPVPYREVIRPGAFRRSIRGARSGRFRLVYEHRDDLGNVIGPAVELVERDDGLHGTFRVLDGTLGDHALEIVRSGTCTGLSVTALVHPEGTKVTDGLVERTLLTLEHVALTGTPAYSGAGVTAIRSDVGTLDLAPPSIERVLARSAELRARYDR